MIVIISYEISLLRTEMELLAREKKGIVLNPDNQSIMYIRKHKPKLIILDLSSAESLIYEVYTSIKKEFPETKFILTGFQKFIKGPFENVNEVKIFPYNTKKVKQVIKEQFKL
ncbi:MAG: hypothetical protein RMJ38_05205 [candidate division WOR-3 bacterium]|nr:hypothetical protein [candidate division WOR-3 bacterium]MDW8150818.1 hypothetical protein [candidate division WOR-3 bacterium]